MKLFFSFTLIVLAFQVTGQDSLYAKKIDSLWKQSYQRHNLIQKRDRTKNKEIIYSFYKDTKKLRSITVFTMLVQPGLFIFFYKKDSVVMISPIGQQPYYILNDTLAYAKSLEHTSEEILLLINKAKEYRTKAYKN